MNYNRLLKEIEYLKKKEERKYEHYLQLYNDTFNQYKACDESLLKIKLIPVWRCLTKSEHRIGAFNEILNSIVLFHKGKVNYDVCDYMIDCDDCGNCDFTLDFMSEFSRGFL